MIDKRKNLRNVVAGVICLAGMMMIWSCEKECKVGEVRIDKKCVDTTTNNSVNNSNNKIVANVENGNDYNSTIDSVKIVAYYYDDDDNYKEIVLAAAAYKNGAFTLELPKTVDSKYLYSMDEDDFPTGITISERNVKSDSYSVRAYKNGQITGIFTYASTNQDLEEAGDVEAEYIYVDRDVNITGKYSFEDGYDDYSVKYNFNYNFKLKKGWNLIYFKLNSISVVGETMERTMEGTTQKPNVPLKWYYNGWFEDGSTNVQKSNRSTLVKNFWR